MKILKLISRFLLGIVFLFSGFVKIVDPLGTAYKIEDYLLAFGDFFTTLTWAALPGSILLSTFEFLLGVCLLFYIKPKITAWLTMLMMAAMTPLTLYIALTNPVTNCGCFGDAVVLSNWETFWKNIVLVALVIILLIKNKKTHPVFLPKVEWSIIGVFASAAIGLASYSLLNLPILDFRPYKIGVNINEAMQIPGGAEHDQYETTFTYAKNGLEQEFTLENYPKSDSTWTFVRQNTKLIKKGFVPLIHDFSIVTPEMDDITYDILLKDGYTLIAVMYDLNKTNLKTALKLNRVHEHTICQGVEFFALTASSSNDIEEFRQKTGAEYPFYATDPITLKTIVRANPGMILIKNGVVVEKWNVRTLKKYTHKEMRDMLVKSKYK